jgi:hypothetical protein
MSSEPSALNRLLMARAYSPENRGEEGLVQSIPEEAPLADDVVFVAGAEGRFGPVLVQCGVVVRIFTVVEEQ